MTLQTLLEDNFSKHEFYPIHIITLKDRASYDRQVMIRAFYNASPISHRVVCGHLPYWFFIEKDTNLDDSFFFTILRDPVERVISHYFFRKDRPGEEISSPLEIPCNIMCKMLCSDITLSGESLLEDCKKSLERMDFILFFDDLEGSIHRLFRRLGLRRRENIPQVNITPKKKQVSSEIKQKIAALNDLDVRLYEYANRHLRHKSYTVCDR